ncbi:MAG: HPF/RaiA family ribosome-associated protein [Vicinamibacterales bacterium]
MPTPITVTFPRTTASPWLEEEVHERVERLKVLFKDILSCRVVVDIPHRRHQKGNRFSVRIELAVPGEDLAITRDANVHGVVKDSDEASWSKRFDVEAARRDIRLVLADAFDAAKRQLRDYAQVRRREVKRHDPPVRGFAPAAATRPRRTVAKRQTVSAC